MIAGGENRFVTEAEQAREFAERGAFAVSLVAEADVDRVALVAEHRQPRAQAVEETAEVIHVAVRRSDAADVAALVVEVLHALEAFEIGEHFREQRPGEAEHLVVQDGAARIPVAERLPSSVGLAVVDVALLHNRVVGLHGQRELAHEPVVHVPEGAARVHGPLHAGGAQVAQRGDHLRNDGGLGVVVDDGAVEVGAQELEHQLRVEG